MTTLDYTSPLDYSIENPIISIDEAIESLNFLNTQDDLNNNYKEKTKMPPLRGNKEVKSSDALRKAKAKYYQKKKEDEAYMQDMRDRAYAWYQEHKALPDAKPRGRGRDKRITQIETYFPKLTTIE